MEETVRYAGFWRRAAAAIIDILLIFFVLAPLIELLITGIGYLSSNEPPDLEWLTRSWPYLLIWEAVLALLVIFLWVRFQTTPGKYMLDCYVVDITTFKALTLRQALLRYVGYLVSLLPLGLGFLWVAFDKRKRGFHDLIAGSVVVVRITGPFESDESQKSLEQLMKESS